MTLCHWLASTICSSSKATTLIWLSTMPGAVTSSLPFPPPANALATTPIKFSVTVTALTVKAVLACLASKFRALAPASTVTSMLGNVEAMTPANPWSTADMLLPVLVKVLDRPLTCAV
jgi:hypothetical protein